MNFKEVKKTKIAYYKDELRDDFNEVGLSRPPVPEGYKYKRTNFFNNIISGIFYHGIAKPIFALFCIFHGIRIKNRKNLKAIKGQGAFFYSNHVSISDVFKFQTLVFFFARRINILGYSDSLSMPIVRNLTRALGYLPLPLKGDLKNAIALMDAMEFYIKKKQHILIYPEAHIWPYYTKIRPFRDGSFNYPAKCNAPVVPVVTTWRKPLIGKIPRQTVYILEPIFPLEGKTATENKTYLHDETLRAMQEFANSVPQYEYIKYVKVEDDNNDSQKD